MNKMLIVFAMLLVATFFFHTAINYMAANIEDFESVALPPKKPKKIKSLYSLVKVDAAARNSWTLLDFSSLKTHRIDDLEKQKDLLESLNWDLAFKRTRILTSGGETTSNSQAGVINLGPGTLDTVQEIPRTGYTEDDRTFGKLANDSLTDWYIYRTRTHNIESKKNRYIMRTWDGNFVKFRFLNYYCKNEESDCSTMMCSRDEAACYTIEYAKQTDGSFRFPPPPSEAPQTVPQSVSLN